MPTTINPSDQTITQYNLQTGGANNLLNNVAPSATSGVPMISQGSSSQPVFGTAVVAGGGTGNTSQAAYSLVCGGTTTTGAFQSVADVATGSVLISGGTTALPSFSAFPQVSGLGIGASAGSTTGLTFDGTSFLKNFVDSTAWTPSIDFATVTTGITYSTQVGYYTRIGNIVFITFNVTLSSKGAATGQLFLAGLPIAAGSKSSNFNLIGFTSVTLTANYTSMYFSTTVSGTRAQAIQIGSGQALAQVTNTQIANTSAFVGQGFYFISTP